MEAGRYSVNVDVELLPWEEVGVANNYGVEPRGTVRVGRYYPRGNLIRAPLPEDANDTEAMCVLGHEVLHVIYGAWHGESWVER